ncbi:MAG: hypothetical protein AAF092_10045 [Pseudomonadota bacterium]
MSDPTRQGVPWGRLFRLTLRFFGGSFLGFLGWLAWSYASLDAFGFYFFGILGLWGGLIVLVRASVELIQILIGSGQWRRYRRLGRKPKADTMAKEHDLTQLGRR